MVAYEFRVYSQFVWSETEWKLSPIVKAYRPHVCGRCGVDVTGPARWRWLTQQEKELLHSGCVPWSEVLEHCSAGKGLCFPRAPRTRANVVTFNFNTEDYETQSHGKPSTHEQYAEEREELADASEEGFDLDYAA